MTYYSTPTKLARIKTSDSTSISTDVCVETGPLRYCCGGGGVSFGLTTLERKLVLSCKAEHDCTLRLNKNIYLMISSRDVFENVLDKSVHHSKNLETI